MNKVFGQSKKAVLALSNPEVFQTIEAALKKVGCEVTDDFEAAGDGDVVVMDSFYQKSGMANFIKIRNNHTVTFLILLEKEKSGFQERLAEHIDHTFILESHQTPEDLFSAMVDWFKDSCALSVPNFSSREFGNGLWVSMISQLGTAG